MIGATLSREQAAWAQDAIKRDGLDDVAEVRFSDYRDVRGKFDRGWDVLREETFARQKQTGIIPADAELTPRPPYIPAWNSLKPHEQHLYTRQMEVAAAQLAYLDDQFGRVLDYLRNSGQIDNTLIMFIQGDNGASEEYEFGDTNYDLYGTGIEEKPADMAPRASELGGPRVHGQYAPGWAWLMNAPFPESKQIASHLGGLRDGLVVSWPNRIRAHGEVRTQFSHVIDVVPTIYEAAGITPPEKVDGVVQQPIEGTSMVYSFSDAKAPERHRTQYFEMLGNRSFYKEGWLASTVPPLPVFSEGTRFLKPDTFKWALFDLRRDYSQMHDVSADYPARLAEMKAAFEAEAKAHNVYPLTSDILGRMSPDYRPKVLTGSGPRTYPAGETRYRTSSFPPLSVGWKGVANIQLASGNESGPIFSQGNQLTFVTLALEQGVPVYTYSPTGRPQATLRLMPPAPLGPGKHTITIETGTAKPITLTMSVDGKQVGRATVPFFGSGITPEAFVGRPLLDDRTSPRTCGCTIDGVTITQVGR